MLYDFIVVLLVSSFTLFIISRMNVGIHIPNYGQALLFALVLGLINAFVRPVLKFLSFPITFITLGLFLFVINAFAFWLAAKLTPSVKLSRGCISALVGSLLVAIINSVALWLLGSIGLI